MAALVAVSAASLTVWREGRSAMRRRGGAAGGRWKDMSLPTVFLCDVYVGEKKKNGTIRTGQDRAMPS